MYWYKGVFLDSEEDIKFVDEIESMYDVGTLKFNDKDSLLCHLEYDGEVCSSDYDCKTIENKESILLIAKENRVGVSWNS